MDTFNAIYEDGKLKFEQKPKRKKGRVLVTFIDEKSTKAELPVFSLGKIKDTKREDLYESRLSD